MTIICKPGTRYDIIANIASEAIQLREQLKIRVEKLTYSLTGRNTFTGSNRLGGASIAEMDINVLAVSITFAAYKEARLRFLQTIQPSIAIDDSQDNVHIRLNV